MQFKQCPKRRYESDLEMAKSFGFAQERHQRTATRSRQSGGWCDSHNNSQIWQVQVTECHRHWIWMDMIPLESQSHCFRKYHFITRGLFLCQHVTVCVHDVHYIHIHSLDTCSTNLWIWFLCALTIWIHVWIIPDQARPQGIGTRQDVSARLRKHVGFQLSACFKMFHVSTE
jgi:hypothetical protein